MLRILTCITLITNICVFGTAAGQTGQISGKVTCPGASESASTVTLLNGNDSSWIRTDMTNDQGFFTFSNLPVAAYIVVASRIGCLPGSQAVVVSAATTSNCIIPLQQQNSALAEISVTARKPFIEMSLGKLVVNIEGTATTGSTTALDLLHRLPGITVDMNGNIVMQGKPGITVMVDGRDTYLSGQDLAEFLKTISADEVSQIELITQPGARYEAAGNNGIININLKKNRKQGFNGNATIGCGEGVYPRRNESLLLHYRHNKLNLSLSGSDMSATGFADWKENINYYDPATGALTGASTVHSSPVEHFSNTALRLNADYDLSGKTTAGINLNGTYHPNSNNGFLSIANTDQNHRLTSYNEIITPDGFIRKNQTANAYFTDKFSKESSLDINLDYLLYQKNEYQDITNTLYDPLMIPLQPANLENSQQNMSISVFSMKADYTRALQNGMKLEAGAKASAVTTDNNAAFVAYQNHAWINDTNRTNHFIYRENILAAYVTIGRSFGARWEAKMGLRTEQTMAQGDQFIGNNTFRRNYFAPFPTGFLTYKMDSSNLFELNFGRRIDRPAYQQLNPFIFYSFENYYDLGNPGLQPQYTWSAELKHSYKNSIVSKLNYTSTTHVISDRYVIVDSNRTMYDINENIASNRYLVLSVMVSKDLFPRWSFNASGSVFYASFTGPAATTMVATRTWSGYSFNINTQISLGKGWKAEGNGYYTSGGHATTTQTFDANLYLEVGASKKINDRFLLKFSAEDPFYLTQLGLHDRSNSFTTDSRFRYASRYGSVSLTYNFGGNDSYSQKENALEESKRIK